MRQRAVLIGGAIVVLALGAIVAVAQTDDVPAAAPADRQADLVAGETLYAQYCAACHGGNLEGQANWQSPGSDGRLPAPPHDASGHTWHHADSLLFTYTKLGGRETLAAQGMDFDSGMPGFGEQLSDEDIWNILAYIKSTWPERIRVIQAERTAAEEAG